MSCCEIVNSGDDGDYIGDDVDDHNDDGNGGSGIMW